MNSTTAYAVSGDDLVESIERTITDNQVRPDGDLYADTLEGRLRLLLPSHANFQNPHSPNCGCGGFVATWTEPGATWKVVGTIANDTHDGIYNVLATRSGEEPKLWMEQKVTINHVVDALRFIGAIN